VAAPSKIWSTNGRTLRSATEHGD